MPTLTSDRQPGGNPPHLFCFGLGYTALMLARRIMREGWRVSGTCRSEAAAAAAAAEGIHAVILDRGRPMDDPKRTLATVTDILSAVPPDADGDTVLDHHGDDLTTMEGLRWVGYLSTTGVYGDTGGVEVKESAPLQPSSERGRRRVAAEARWLSLPLASAASIHVFRLAGIYGPRRNVFETIRSGKARRIDRPGHLFSRIHVDDIATVLRASIAQPEAGQVFNVCDDEPAEPATVTAYACALLGIDPPPLQRFDDAAPTMSPMALSFWRDNRRVSNALIKQDLGIVLAYPSYREGLAAILEHARRADADVDTRPKMDQDS